MAISFRGPVPVPAAQSSPLRVLITGASRGIGFELVRQYVDAHADNVVFAAVRDPKSETSAAVNAIAAKHPNVHVITLDVSKEESIRKSAAFVTPLTDRLDVVYNNAGIIGERDPLIATTEQLTTVFHTNVAGPLTVVQTFLPLLRKSTVGAKVVQVSSGLGSNQHANVLGTPFTAYGISKAGLNYLNTVLSHAIPDVAFLSINPGWVETDMGKSGGGAPPTKVKDSVQAIRYYTALKGIKNTGEYFDVMSGDNIPY